MSISIPEEKITDSLITAYMKHRRGPEGDLIWQDHFQELAEILIKHGIVSPLVRWTEITDDPATWPPANVVVLTQDAANIIGMHFHGNSHEPLWWQPENMFVDAPPGSMDGPIAWEDYSLSDSQNITHWRPI